MILSEFNQKKKKIILGTTGITIRISCVISLGQAGIIAHRMRVKVSRFIK